jgi:hypothetical protein
MKIRQINQNKGEGNMKINNHLSSFYKPMQKFLVLAILVSSTLWAQGQTFNTVNNGSWVSPGVWQGGNVPTHSGGLNNKSTVNINHNVTLIDESFTSLNNTANLTINIGLETAANLVIDYNFTISSTIDIVVYAGSTFQIGNAPSDPLYNYCDSTSVENSIFKVEGSSNTPTLHIKSGATFIVYGDFLVNNKFNIIVEDGANFIVKGSFTAGNSADVNFQGAGGYIGCDMNFDNGAVIKLDVGSIYVGGDLLFGNSADIYMSGSDIEVKGGICSFQGIGSGAVVELHGDTLNPSTISAGYICQDVDIDPVPGIIIEDISTLPIELIHFEATATSYSIDVLWSTATEINNNFFTIERSSDMITWDIIGVVAGAGTTSAVHNYQFADQSPAAGLTYYRLKQTDFDGSFEYFAPIAVVFDPASDEINFKVLKTFESWYVSLPGDNEFKVEVYDLSGRRLFSGNGVNNISIPAQGHPVIMRVIKGNVQAVSRIVM